MKYTNSLSGLTVQLDPLNDEERSFFQLAYREFKKNVPWLAFDELVFGTRCPLFSRSRSYPDVLEHPLFLALKDMSIQLGVQQGLIARPGSRKGAAVAERRKKARRRQAAR